MKKSALTALSAAAVIALSACGGIGGTTAQQTTAAPAPAQESSHSSILITYFSRYGNTPYDDDIDASAAASVAVRDGRKHGTTELVARDIQSHVGGDLFFIRSRESYPVDFDVLVDQNHREIAEQYFPELTEMPDTSKYDVVFVGYPVWANTIPRPVATFIRNAELAGKTVIPFCTHDGYRSGRSYSDIADLAGGADVTGGFDVEATQVPQSRDRLYAWLDSLPAVAAARKGDDSSAVVIDGRSVAIAWDDTPLAREIRTQMPLTVSMVGYGGREYYGPLPFRPSEGGEGKRSFADGDVTYCPQNNTIAIFYAQTDRPNLTMDVIRIGRVTDDLAVFHELDSTVSMTFR